MRETHRISCWRLDACADQGRHSLQAFGPGGGCLKLVSGSFIHVNVVATAVLPGHLDPMCFVPVSFHGKLPCFLGVVLVGHC